MNSSSSTTNFSPKSGTGVLLHSCCAPCSGGILTRLLEVGIHCTVFFYNPNIHPREEYEKRKGEIIRFAMKIDVPFIDADYDPEAWQNRIQGLENEPERGRRCEKCFDLRLERAALYAHEHAIPVLATTLSASRWKDITQINAAGLRACHHYAPGLTFWEKNWREEGGDKLSDQISRQEKFYRQKYCGCKYSLAISTRKKISLNA